MRYVNRSVVLIATVAALLLVVPTASANDQPCSVRGGGVVTNDAGQFSGSASTENGEYKGRWTHRTVSGDQLAGVVLELECLTDGGGPAGSPDEEPNRAFVDGEGTWNGITPARFHVTMADRGEPNTRDEYGIVVVSETNELLYSGHGVVALGNIQIMGSNKERS